MKKIFISDCEGPISKNDNAFELAKHFIPNGDKIFSLVSKYDDILVEVLNKPNYVAGGTLKFILPFLKAYGVTDRKMREFSAKNLILIKNSKNTIQHTRRTAGSYIVSTSYEHYIAALCNALDFPFENTYCTRVSLDTDPISETQKVALKKIADEIAQIPMIYFPETVYSLKDFSDRDQESLERLNEIFWTQILNIGFEKLFSEVIPVGGSQKAEAVEDAVKRMSTVLEDAMYVGDSITDTDAFELVRANGGLTVSFNGNHYATRNAEIAVLSEDNTVLAILFDAFCKQGRQKTLRLVEKWNHESLRSSNVETSLIERLFRFYPNKLPKTQIVTAENMGIVSKESSEFRKKVRGESIGGLG